MKKNLVLLLGIPSLASGQSTISDTANQAYVPNAGWLTFRPSVANGTVVTETYLTGWAYGANFGWVRLGYIRPDNYHTWSNLSATDFGVNVSSTGQLSGHAYSANTGWITFEQTYGQPRINLLTGQFLGHAYSANLGWIALNAAPVSGVFSPVISTPDNDADGMSDAWEQQNFQSFSVATATSDFDGDGVGDVQEFLAGTDPKDASDRPRITLIERTSGTTANLTFVTRTNRFYDIRMAPDLAGPWTDSGLGVFPAGNGLTTKSVTHPAGSKMFFKAGFRRPLQP